MLRGFLISGILAAATAAQYAFPFHHSNSPRFPVKGVGVVRSFNGVTGEGGPVHGIIVFTQTTPTAPVTISGQISGLSPGLHGFHIHQMGNLSEGCASLGGHFNPEGHTHGGPTYYYRHVGDLGNIEAASDGVATVYIIDSRISLTGVNGILGRGLVVHSDEDDYGKGGDTESLKTGNAGVRVGCGIIGLSLEIPETAPRRPIGPIVPAGSLNPFSASGAPAYPRNPLTAFLSARANSPFQQHQLSTILQQQQEQQRRQQQQQQQLLRQHQLSQKRQFGQFGRFGQSQGQQYQQKFPGNFQQVPQRPSFQQQRQSGNPLSQLLRQRLQGRRGGSWQVRAVKL